MVAALRTFAKAYPDIRRIVLELAADIKIVAANVHGATAGVVEVQVEKEGLLSPREIEASFAPPMRAKPPADTAVAASIQSTILQAIS
jgi:hypothetical protein